MTDDGERLARALHTAVPQPPRELDGAAIRTSAAPRAGRSRLVAPVLAAVAVVAVAIGVFLAVHHPAQRPTAAGPSASQSPRAVTERVVARLLAAVPTVPGSTAVDHSPLSVLGGPLSEPASSNLVSRTRWWTAPGSAAAALSYVRAHLPAGVTPDGSSSSGGGAGPAVQGLEFAASGRQWQRPTLHTEPELIVAVAAFGNGVAIRVDAQAVWLPQRTAAEHMPPTVTSVAVVVDRKHSAPTVRRTLPARPARALAKLLNGLPVALPTIGCPADRGFSDTLTFHDATGTVHVRVTVGGCGGVTIFRPDQLRPVLGGSERVNTAVTKALGLPANYGQ